MRWLQKAPTVGDEVMFVVWDMHEQAAQRRYGNVISTFSNLAKRNVDDGGRLKLIHTRVRSVGNGTLRDANDKRQYDPTKLASVSCTYATGVREIGTGVAQFSYARDEVEYGMKAALALPDARLSAFAMQFIYPVVVADKDYMAMLNDIGAATGNEQLLNARFGGVVSVAHAIAEAEALGVEIVRNERAFDVFAEFGTDEREDTQKLLQHVQQIYLDHLQNPQLIDAPVNVQPPVMAAQEVAFDFEQARPIGGIGNLAVAVDDLELRPVARWAAVEQEPQQQEDEF